MAQRIKIKSWENFVTKEDILSFDMPSYRSLVSAIGLIWILQYGPLNGMVLLLLLGLGPGRPSIHLARFSITFL